MSDEGPRDTEGSERGGADVPPAANGGTTDHGETAGRTTPLGESATEGRDGATARNAESGWATFARDIVTSALAVMLVGAYLFAISGVWPPLVAIESGSMQPNMEKNDLVFVMSEERFPGEGAINDTGVVPASVGQEVDYSRFNNPGDVIVYQPGGRTNDVPIIHRAMFYVEAGEDWTQRADPEHLGRSRSCEEIVHCPAERSGFVTKGDAPQNYDQLREAGARTGVVSPDWVIGTAEVRVPGLGWLRLRG